MNLQGGGGRYAARLFILFFFPCSADHEGDWPPIQLTLNVRHPGQITPRCVQIFLETLNIEMEHWNGRRSSILEDEDRISHYYCYYRGNTLWPIY